jgi:hypothetical protein
MSECSDVVRVVPHRDNATCIRLGVTECDTGRFRPVDMSAVTNIQLRLGTKEAPTLDIDSYFRPDAISWNVPTGSITLNLGHESIPAGMHQAFLTYFTAINPNGIAVDPFNVLVDTTL